MSICLVLAASERGGWAVEPETLGLQRHGRYWIFPEELEIREKFTAMNDLARRTALSERQYGLMVADNKQLWQRHQHTSALIDQLASNLKAKAVGTDEEKRLAGQIEQLKAASRRFNHAVSPEKLATQPHARSILVDISSSRQEFLLTLFAARQQLGKLQRRYEALPTALAAKLSEGEAGQLGPLVAFTRMQQSLDRLQPLAFSNSVPILPSGDQRRVVVVLNQRAPAMLTIVPNSHRVILTSNMAQAAGIQLSDRAPVEIEVPFGESTVTARVAQAESLHLGGAGRHNAEVFVLAPEQEHLGGFFGLSFLQAHGPEVDLVESRLMLKGSALESTAGP